MLSFLLVGAGGFLGSLMRFSLSAYFLTSGSPFSKVTLIVNLTGSLLIGIMLQVGQEKIGNNFFLFLVPGILGGFTTYSAFAGEALMLYKNQGFQGALIYVLITTIGGFIAAAAGYGLGKLFH